MTSPPDDIHSSPSKDALYGIAQDQHGYFTTSQAIQAGYSNPLLHKYLRNGEMHRIRHGIYRLVRFPPSENEGLVVLWLWTKQEGTLSHETALALHDLSDILPANVTMTVPARWAKRRMRKPVGLELRYADLKEADWSYKSAIPITTPLRTLQDCIEAHVAPDLIEQALRQARQRGLISQPEARQLKNKLRKAIGAS